MDELNVYKFVRENNGHIIWVCMQVKGLVDTMIIYVEVVIHKGECSEIIERLCIKQLFYYWTW